jgi:DNA mismatch endonuclease (patch repair protein)
MEEEGPRKGLTSFLTRVEFPQEPMADVLSKRKRSQVMAAVRSTGNKGTELRLASILRAHRIKGWRRHRPLPGTPDFLFPKQRLALFVDGCFWHGCRWHCRMPRDNRRYWQNKISRDTKRDRDTIGCRGALTGRSFDCGNLH